MIEWKDILHLRAGKDLALRFECRDTLAEDLVIDSFHCIAKLASIILFNLTTSTLRTDHLTRCDYHIYPPKKGIL